MYAPESVPDRIAWYGRLGHEVTEVTEDHLAAGDFVSEHFSERRLRGLLGDCVLHGLGGIAFLAEV